jgi:Ca2+-transporting ATPase
MTPDAAPSVAVGIPHAWSRSAETVLADLNVDPASGLSSQVAAERLRVCGPNQLSTKAPRRVLAILLDQFRSIVVLLLLAAGVLAFFFGEHLEGFAIFAVVALNSGIGFVTEWRAVRSMESLGRLGRVETVVVRDGEPTRIPAEDLVPGDIVLREGGDVVTADMRIVEAAGLQSDESTLTGESMPVDKSIDTLPASAVLMDRRNMLFKGTAITRGSGRAVVVGTGVNTELGRISTLVKEAEPEESPLEKRLDALAQRLVWIVLALAAALAIVGVMTGQNVLLAIEVAIALAVAAIPEGLPIVATIALARGMWRMARRNALIARLSAVETLGATSVILTDKTGTLTENRMAVTVIELADGRFELPVVDGEFPDRVDEILRIASLCSNAALRTDRSGDLRSVGDPMEVALLMAAHHRGIDRDRLLDVCPELEEVAFDPDTKLMATIHDDDGGSLVAVKGAPESVIARAEFQRGADGRIPMTDEDRAFWADKVQALAGQGLRTLAVAIAAEVGQGDAYSGMELLGIVALEDPARPGVAETIRRCGDAGIRVVMLTGDHLATARKIAEEVGIVGADAGREACISGEELDLEAIRQQDDRIAAARVFSRVTPEQKLALIEFYQRRDQVVAMTGDGVNDAPALKKADIGVAMGVRGTAVAKEAAAMILQDDEFGTIVDAVSQGRAIYENIRKFVVYLLSCNMSEVLVVSLATIAGAPLPLLPLQILFLNLVTDVFPALALGVGEGSPQLMRRLPRPAGEAMLTRAYWIRIVAYGSIISATVLASMAIAIYGLGFDIDRAVTVSFCTLALAQVWHVFNMRSGDSGMIVNEITRNVWIWAAVLLCVLLVVAAVYLPLLADVLSLANPGAKGWQVIVVMSFVPVALAPAIRVLVPGAARA